MDGFVRGIAHLLREQKGDHSKECLGSGHSGTKVSRKWILSAILRFSENCIHHVVQTHTVTVIADRSKSRLFWQPWTRLLEPVSRFKCRIRTDADSKRIVATAAAVAANPVQIRIAQTRISLT